MNCTLRINNLHTGYPDRTVIKGVSFDIPEGKAIALLGKNGAGKTTLLRALSGVLPVASGQVDFFGTNVTNWPPDKLIRSGFAYMPQGRMCYLDLTVEENIKVALLPLKLSNNESVRSIDYSLSIFDQLRKSASIKVHNVSGGIRQMLVLAMALAPKPKCILLDEPSIGLSTAALEVLKKLLFSFLKEGRTILLVDQNLDLVYKIADYIFYLKDGRIFLHGPPEEIKHNPEFLKDYIGITDYTLINNQN